MSTPSLSPEASSVSCTGCHATELTSRRCPRIVMSSLTDMRRSHSLMSESWPALTSHRPFWLNATCTCRRREGRTTPLLLQHTALGHRRLKNRGPRTLKIWLLCA